MSLWLCLRFPHIPLESLSQETERPVVVLERERVFDANDLASMAGVRHGQNGQTVRSLLETDEPLLLERDPVAEQQTLEQLRLWCYSITPTLELWQGDSVQLEVGSCLKLYRGIESLTAQLQRDLTCRGHRCTMGLATNRQAAWLLSHDEGEGLTMNAPLKDRLTPLPIELLVSDHSNRPPNRRFERDIDNLKKAGVYRIGELLALPLSALGRRCGKPFMAHVQAISAERDDTRQDFTPPPVFNDALWFGFEIRNSVELEPAMAQLLEGFCRYLRNTQRYSTCIEWQLLRHKQDPQRIVLRSSEAHRSAERWLELSTLKLAHIAISEDIEGLGLHVTQFSDIPPGCDDLFSDRAAREPLHSVVDRLRTRLGRQSVSQLALRDTHLPEHSVYSSQEAPVTAVTPLSTAQRPFWLMREPQPVRQEQGTLHWNGPLTLIYGPERIEDNWWERPASRDYYIATTGDGQPLWLYQDRHTQLWYVQGVFA